jgi:hypothetical protein
MPPKRKIRRPVASGLAATPSSAACTERGSELAVSFTIVTPSGVRQVSMRVGPKE